MPSSCGLLAPLGEEYDPSPPRGSRWYPTRYEEFIPERRRKLEMIIEEFWMDEGRKFHTSCNLGNHHYMPGMYGKEARGYGGYAGYAAVFDHFQAFLWDHVICGEGEEVTHEFLRRRWGCNWYDEYEESEDDKRKLRLWTHARRLYAEKHPRTWHTGIRYKYLGT